MLNETTRSFHQQEKYLITVQKYGDWLFTGNWPPANMAQQIIIIIYYQV